MVEKISLPSQKVKFRKKKDEKTSLLKHSKPSFWGSSSCYSSENNGGINAIAKPRTGCGSIRGNCPPPQCEGKKQHFKKNTQMATLAWWLSSLEHCPVHQKACRFDSQSGSDPPGGNELMFLSH